MSDENAATNDNTDSGSNSGENAVPDWRTDLGDLAKHEKLSGFKSAKELAKAFVDSPEPVTLPQSAEEYKVPEAVKIKGLRKMAHKNKFTQTQLDGLLEYHNSVTSETLEQIKEKREKAASELKTTWGNDYDKNLDLAKRALKHFDSKEGEVSKLLTEAGMGSDPRVLKFMHKLGGTLKEGSFMKDDGNVKKPAKSVASRLFPNHPAE